MSDAGKTPLDRLNECREKIDAIDVDIVALLNARTTVVHEIGRVKRELDVPVYEPKREQQVFENITSANHGPLTNDALMRVFERIIDEMRTIQKNMKNETTGGSR